MEKLQLLSLGKIAHRLRRPPLPLLPNRVHQTGSRNLQAPHHSRRTASRRGALCRRRRVEHSARGRIGVPDLLSGKRERLACGFGYTTRCRPRKNVGIKKGKMRPWVRSGKGVGTEGEGDESQFSFLSSPPVSPERIGRHIWYFTARMRVTKTPTPPTIWQMYGSMPNRSKNQ